VTFVSQSSSSGYRAFDHAVLVNFSEVIRHAPTGDVGRLVRVDDLSSCVHNGVPQGGGDNPVEGVPDNNGSRILHQG